MNPLAHESLLIGLGEVSAAFVGFSLVVEILRSRSEGTQKELRRVKSMRDVAEIGLIAAGASFLPLVIDAFGASPEATWRLASAALVGVAGASVGSSVRRKGGVMKRTTIRSEEPIRFFLVPVLNLGAFGLCLSNVLVVGSTSGARYAAAVFLSLAIGGVLFVGTIFSSSENRPSA